MANRTPRFLKIVERVGNGKKIDITKRNNERENVSEFLESASKLRKEIYILKKYIEKTRRDYVDPYRHFSDSFRSRMSDKERDVVENKVQKSLKHLVKNLDILKEQVVHGNEAPDSVESRKGVLMILFQQMDSVSSYFQIQRSKRVQQEHIIKDGWLCMTDGDHVELSDELTSPIIIRKKENKNNTESLQTARIESAKHFHIPIESQNKAIETLENNPQQFVQLQKENTELLNELQNKVDQVRIVEKQVVEISTLQETFSTKVEEQAEEIENLHQLAVESTMRVSHAKDILNEAASEGINFRLFILVLLSTMSIALLFVHSYN